jgi:hypothetical protein
VPPSLGIAVVLREAKVNYIDCVAVTIPSDKEVLGLDIAVNQFPLGMYRFYARDHFVGEKQHGLESEGSIAVVKLVF